MDALKRSLTSIRVLRTAFFVFWFAFALFWAIPRVVPRLVGDRFFLREEFFHPAAYRVGGLTIAGRTFGGSTVDCSGMKRVPAAFGVNLLANPGLDGPCGWGFAPHLGDKAATERTASSGRCFRLDDASYAFQDLRLGPLAAWIDRGEAVFSVSGRFLSDGRSEPGVLVQVAPEELGAWTTLPGALATGSGARWREFSRSVEVPQGTRVLRLTLGTAGRAGSVRFDDVSAVIRRSFTPPG